MLNCKEEFTEHVSRRENQVICALVRHGEDSYEDSPKAKIYLLRVGHSRAEYDIFLSNLDFNYDDGYGAQELFGTIWYSDGSWSGRREYDGSEWWEYQYAPEIPEELKRNP